MRLQILHECAFDGPSLWLDRPVVRVIVAGSSEEGRGSELRQRIELLDRRLDRAQFDPFPLPSQPGRSDVISLLAWAAVGLQRLAGDDVSFFRTGELEPPGTSEVVVECRHRQTGFLALRIALWQLNAGGAGHSERETIELERAFTQRLVPVSASRRPILEFGCILAAARARAIPITSIDPRGLVHELGHGVYRRRVRNVRTSNTSFLGETISSDKQLAVHYLAECGLPVPETMTARDADEAVACARTIGFPVAVKPNDAGDSIGLHLDVRDADEVRAAFEDAVLKSRSGTVVVQRYLVGRHYRILVVGDRIIGLTERIAAHVVGDGRHSVRELVGIENRNPRRGTRKSDRLKRIAIDQASERLLEKQGLTLDDVPPYGLWVQLQRIDDIEGGGEAIAFTGTVHQDNVAIVTSAARALEVDIAGIDLIAEDIERSIWETSGGILEVNCSPGFSLLQFPTSGEAIDPGPAIVETLFPSGAPVRVPLVAVTGDRDTTEVARLIGRMLTAAGNTPGIALRDGLSLGKTTLSGIDSAGISGKRRVLLNPSVEMAVLEIPPDEIVAEGLAFEQCDVAVVTGLSGVGPVGLPEAESVVCRTVVSNGMLVVPAGDPEVLELARRSGREIAVYGLEEAPATEERSVAQREVEGRTVLEIVWEGRRDTLSLDRALPSGAPAVIAAVLALGCSLETVRRWMVESDISCQVG